MKGISSITGIAWKGVRRKLLRNATLSTAVAFLVGLLVFALLFNKAVEEEIELSSQRLGADIVLVPREAKSVAEEFILESKVKSFYMDRSVYDAILGLPGIAAATYQIYLNTMSAGCCSIDEGQVVAFDSVTDFVVKPWLSDSFVPLARNQVYVGSYVYEYQGLIDTASLFGKEIKVVGKLEETGTGLDRGIFVRLSDLDELSESASGAYKSGMISIVFIKIEEGVDTNTVVDAIREINPRIGLMTRGEIGADIRVTLRDIMRVFSVTILISSFLSIMLAWSTFTAMANERRREIGILRAIGAGRSQVQRIMLTEALLVGISGGLLGVAIGHYLIYDLASNFNLLGRIGAEYTLTWSSSMLSLSAMGAGVLVCLLGALFPVSRLAIMEPLLAISQD